MNEEKKTLDEKTLEDVSGGELLGNDSPDLPSGGCNDCACSSPDCPYRNNMDILMKKRSGEERCYQFIPKF